METRSAGHECNGPPPAKISLLADLLLSILMLAYLRTVGVRATCTTNFRFFSASTIRYAAVSDVPSLEARGLIPTERIRNIAIIAHGW